MPLLLSTGATHRHGRPADQLVPPGTFDGFELSALGGDEVDGALERLPDIGQVHHLHAPAHRLRHTDEEVVARLDGTGLPVVVHPDTIVDIGPWRRMGRRTVVENLDGRATTSYVLTAQLGRLFDVLPDARLCLDVSHAVRAGSLRLVRNLARTFSDRVAVLHVGCRSGRSYRDRLDPVDLHAVGCALDFAGPVPVVLERSIPADVDAGRALSRMAAQLRGLTSQTATRAAGRSLT